MDWKSLLAAFALILSSAGLVGVANAESNTETTVTESSEVIELFGKRLCTASAAPDARCDWRLPDMTAKKNENSKAFTLFGKRFCFGEDSGVCDYGVGADKSERAHVRRFLGTNFCFGDVPATAQCDVKLGGTTEEGDRQASL